MFNEFFQKWVRIEEILMKLNTCLFQQENEELLEKYKEICDKVTNTIAY